MDLPNSKRGAYDYFIMDYQQNVRMILTEEAHTASNTATMETSRATLEESIFGQTGTSNEVATTRYATSSTSWTGNSTAQVSRLGTLSGHNIGPNTLQKVMAGDAVSATVQYYHQGSAGGNNSNFLNTVLNSLTPAISGGNAAGNLIKDNATNITNQLSGVNGFINAVQPNGSNPSGNAPQAFLTVIFFDERFNFIPAADGGVAQEQVLATVGTNGSSLTLANIKAPKNGYAYIYLSNQSNNDVYFDNLQVGITQGNIAEENHYYAYGLKIATLSSKKLGDSYEGSLKNNYLYQGAYSELDEDIGWTDFALRNYDAQVGRWVQQDPYQEFATPYTYVGDDPVNFTDPSGGSTLPYQAIKLGGQMSQTAATAITLGEVVLKSVSNALPELGKAVSIFSRIVLPAIAGAINIINNGIDDKPVGFWFKITNEQFIGVLNKLGAPGSNGIIFNKKKGWALENAFQRAYGFTDFQKRRFMPGPTYPDFVEQAHNVDVDNGGISFCIFYEVKAVKRLRLTPQIRNQIKAAAQMSVTNSPYTAGQLGMAEFNLVTFQENLSQPGLTSIIDFAKANNVALSVSYPLYNPVANEIKFSMPDQKTYPEVHQTGKGIRFFVPFERFFRWLFSKRVGVRLPETEYPLTNEDGTDQ